MFPESCNCEQRGKGKWLPLVVSGELSLAFHAEIVVLLFSNIIGISNMIQCMLGSIWNLFVLLFCGVFFNPPPN